MSNNKAPKCWLILRMNGSVELIFSEKEGYKPFLTERSAEEKAEEIVREGMGKVSCLLLESKHHFEFDPVVRKTACLVLEADQAKALEVDLGQ